MSDPFRSQYRELSETEKGQIAEIKARASALNEVLYADGQTPEGLQRGLALARTKLEESVMWAVKGITG